MDYKYENFADDQLIDETDQIRSIAKKSWLNTAGVSLAHLDNVKAKVYNFGLADPRDLKGTNLQPRKANTTTEHTVDNATTLQSSIAWGSNHSIPELVKQHPGHGLPKPTRPESAKYSNKMSRPPSGRKPRPQSAKELIGDQTQSHGTRQGFGVKGAKYDPNGRPPKGVPHTTTTGWVGPPAGLKYPDKPQSPDGSWTIDFPVEKEEFHINPASYMSRDHEVPPPPAGTPVPSTPEPVEQKKKRVFELYIGDPYKDDGNNDDYYDEEEDFIVEDSDDEEFAPPTPLCRSVSDHTSSVSGHTSFISGHTPSVSGNTPSSLSHTPTSISHTPSPGLGEEKESLRLDLPIMEDDYDSADEMDTERLLLEAESVSKQFDLQSIISINKGLPEYSSNHVTDTDLNSTNQNAEHENEFLLANKKKAEDLVSSIISKNGLKFTKDENMANEPIPPLQLEKSSVKFNENVKTVNITPRNIGRKVDELNQGKKKTIGHRDNNFVDLIEMKNRIEPVLSTGKAEIQTTTTTKTGSRPPSGKSRPPVTQSNSSKVSNAGNRDKAAIQDRAVSPTNCNKKHSNHSRPRSVNEPLNRQARPVTMVTVDYGLDENEEDKNTKTKKRVKKYEDVETMMEKMSLTDDEGHLGQRSSSHGDQYRENKDTKFDANTFIPTVFKSEPEKNYYEISRHSSMSNGPTKEEVTTPKESELRPMSRENTVYKTTKTLEFDELKPKEVTIKSALDPHVLLSREKERFMSSCTPDIAKEGRLRSRPSSAKPPVSKPQHKPSEDEGQMDDLERPGSRLGFVSMTPTKQTDSKSKSLHRPSSAPNTRRPKSAQDKENKLKSGKTEGVRELTEEDKAERDKVIDNLLERTKSLLDVGEMKESNDEDDKKPPVVQRKKVRPSSAHVGLVSRMKEQKKLKTAVARRPVSATVTRPTHKHSGSCSHSTGTGTRKSSGKTRTILTEPCIINTNTSYYEEETEEDLACQEMQKQLAGNGLNITAETLQRALYPPSGKSKYYQITADLPKKPSLSLLSHPKAWLPEEYKRLQKAEKTLTRANEIMFLQERAELRRAKLEAMTAEERKKLKKKGKKGKKGGKKLRKSVSVG